MKEVKFNGHSLEMYDSIDELPIVRFQEYNRNVMIDSGVGSDLQSFDHRIHDLTEFIKRSDKVKAFAELQNMRQNLQFIVSKSSPRMNSFVCLIYKMNGKEIDIKYMDSIIKELSRKGLTIGKIKGFLRSVKKKLILK